MESTIIHHICGMMIKKRNMLQDVHERFTRLTTT
jgi:hypothetical protein